MWVSLGAGESSGVEKLKNMIRFSMNRDGYEKRSGLNQEKIKRHL